MGREEQNKGMKEKKDQREENGMKGRKEEKRYLIRSVSSRG